MICIPPIQTFSLSDSHQNKSMLAAEKKNQSNSLHYVICCNITAEPGDHAPFLETHGNSVTLGRSACKIIFILRCEASSFIIVANIMVVLKYIR